jgi:hypothetical protein
MRKSVSVAMFFPPKFNHWISLEFATGGTQNQSSERQHKLF